MTSAQRDDLGNSVVRIRSPTLSIYMRKLKPGVIVMRFFGADSSQAVARLVMREMVRVIEEDGSYAGFTDLRGTTRFNATDREVWTKFFGQYRSKLRPGAVLTSSRIIDMALSLIGLALGSHLVRSTTKEDEFLRLIRVEDPSFTLRDLAALCDAPT